MARVVVLDFKDNDAAEHFVQALLEVQNEDRNSEYAGHEAMAIGAVAMAMSEVKAIVARPTVSCRCRIVGMTQYFREKHQRSRVATGKFIDWRGPERTEYVTAMGRWIKTERFGWLIHDKCKRPAFYPVHRFFQNMLIGMGANNLLPEIKKRLLVNYVAPELPDGSRRNESAEPAGAEILQPAAQEAVPVQSTELP